MEGINYINNINLNQDYVLKGNNKPLLILFINNIINNGNGFNNIEELHNKQFIQNSETNNSNKKKGLNLMKAKVITIIINKLLMNKNVLNHLNIIKKINSKDLKILNNILKIIKKR